MATRRTLILGLWSGLSVPLAGCGGVPPTSDSTESDDPSPPPAASPTSPQQEGPSYVPHLTIINISDDRLTAAISLREVTGTPDSVDDAEPGSERFDESVTLDLSEELDLREYREKTTLILDVTIDDNRVVRELVEPQEGHEIRLISETEAEISTTVV